MEHNLSLRKPTVRKQQLGEEIANAVSHGIGALLAVVGLVLLLIRSSTYGSPIAIVSTAIYGSSMILLYTVSCLYHGITAPRKKQVFQILDHCSIFILILGTYIPIVLIGIGGALGWVVFGILTALAVLGITLNAVNLKKFQKISLILYILMGWLALFTIHPIVEAVSISGLILLLAGGVAYTLGILFYKQKRKRYMHFVWHLFVLADGLTMLLTPIRQVTLPLFAPGALVLGFQLWGMYWKRRALRLSCRTAAAAAQPELLTVEPGQWNEKEVYRRRAGDLHGFGSQIQQEDGAEQLFRFMTPFLLIAAAVFSLLAILIRQQPGLIFWALSGTLIAACTLSGTFCFSLPFRGLSRRLSKLGVALAGWPGVQKAKAGAGILLEDTDLFPPGYIQLDHYEIFGSATDEMVLSVTASLLRESGSGLSGLFYNLIRVEVGRYVPVTDLRIEDEGISGKAMGEDVLVGNLTFLERRGIGIPNEVKETPGVVCAIGGKFAGQFTLSYAMHRASEPSIESLLSNHITPILIALDFNVVPSVMKKQFRIPWEVMSFPSMSERVELYYEPFPEDGSLLAVLNRQGLAALSTAAVGAQRLHKAVKRCASFTCVGAAVGVLLTFYLSVAGALSGLSAVSLTLFLLLWFVPVVLMSSWVNQMG